MGFLKKIFKPVAKVLDKVIPNEIKPALPYLAAFAPVFGPTAGMFGSTIGKRMLLSGGANILGQLAQEGNEGDINLLSAGLGALTGAMTTPGAQGKFADMKFGERTFAEGIRGQKVLAGLDTSNVTGLQKAANVGLDALSAGSKIMSAGAADPFSMAGVKAATLPAATATGDVMQAEARRLEKQQAIDDALAAAELIEDSGARAEAIRNAMLSYGFFTDDEIDSTISSAGYKAGGRVELKGGGIMNAKRGLVDEPGGYAGEMPSIKEIWSKEGEDDPLGTIVKLGLTFRKPIIEIVNAIGVTASVAADLISGVAKLGYDVTEPIRDVVSDVAGGIYDVGKDLVKGSKTDTRFIQPMYYLERFGPEKNLTDEETQLKMMSNSVGRDDPKKRRELENIVFGFDDAGMSQRPEDKEVSETIKFKEKYNFADGGLMNLGGKEMDLRGGGFVPIGKKERADDVPARLSKNEFVMTADAVRAAGGGSVNKGAKRMYDLMNNLEAKV